MALSFFSCFLNFLRKRGDFCCAMGKEETDAGKEKRGGLF